MNIQDNEIIKRNILNIKTSLLNNTNASKIINSIEEYLTNNTFKSNLDKIIVHTLINKKTLNMDRAEISSSIYNSNYIKKCEKEIIEKLDKTYNIRMLSNNELKIKLPVIDTKTNTLLKNNSNNINNKNKNKNNNNNNNNTNIKIINSIDNDNNTNNKICDINLDNTKLLSFLLEELSNFKSISLLTKNVNFEKLVFNINKFELQLLFNHSKFIIFIQKLTEYLCNIASKEYYFESIIDILYNNTCKINNISNDSLFANQILEYICVYLDYLSIIVNKFYNKNFDISKFYLLCKNVKILNSLIYNLYNCNIIYRKLDIKIVLKFLHLFILVLFNNCNCNNYVCLTDNANNISKETINLNNNKYNISTNYILLVLFYIDQDLSIFKVIFRVNTLRSIILNKYFYLFKDLAFISYDLSIQSFHKKQCYLWKHYDVLDNLQNVFSSDNNSSIQSKEISNKTNNKFSKYFLIYSWFSIKICFLGLVVRYSSFKNKFINVYNSDINNNEEYLCCYKLFDNLLKYLINVIFSNKESSRYYLLLEAWQKEKLMFLCKEVLCDIIIYCLNKECKSKKLDLLNNVKNNKTYDNNNNNNNAFLLVLQDIELAFEENKE